MTGREAYMQRLTDQSGTKTNALTELSETYRNLSLDERLQVKRAFQDINADDKLRLDLFGLIEMVEQHFTCSGCGNPKRECDCPPPDPREALYDDPARGAR